LGSGRFFCLLPLQLVIGLPDRFSIETVSDVDQEEFPSKRLSISLHFQRRGPLFAPVFMNPPHSMRARNPPTFLFASFFLRYCAVAWLYISLVLLGTMY